MLVIWPDELVQSALLSRDTNELETLMVNALNITHTDESLVQELTIPLGNYLFRDDFINGNVLCKSFNDVCQCSAFSDKEFIKKFNRLNSMLFKINLFECATILIKNELAPKDVVKSQPTLTPFVGSGVEDLVLDLSHLVGSDGSNLSGPDSVINILTIKLSEDKTIRLVTEEKFNELATKLFDARDEMKHWANELMKVTTSSQKNVRTLPKGRWMPTESNFENPEPGDIGWKKSEPFDKRGYKWFISEKDVWKAAKDMGGTTFGDTLKQLFTGPLVMSFDYPKDFPENMSKACAELLEWIADLRYSDNIKKGNGKPTTSQKKELSCLNEFLHKFYHNYRDRKKNKRKKEDNARELEELRKRLSTDSVLSSSTTNSQDNSSNESV